MPLHLDYGKSVPNGPTMPGSVTFDEHRQITLGDGVPIIESGLIVRMGVTSSDVIADGKQGAVDTGAFPDTVNLSAEFGRYGWRGELSEGCRSMRLEDLRAVYWRRPSAYPAVTVKAGPTREFASREARTGMGACCSPSQVLRG